jgi:hypothetical protein
MNIASEIGHSLWEFSAEAVTAWAAAGALLFAAIAAGAAAWAACIALRQMRENRAISQDADAQESYRSYLEACVNNPELASPNYEKIKPDPQKRAKYNWFICYLLSASEKILEIAGHDAEWVNAVKLNIGYHKDFLSDKTHCEDKQIECYNVDLRKLIFEITGRRLPEDNYRAWSKDKDELAGSAQ